MSFPITGTVFHSPDVTHWPGLSGEFPFGACFCCVSPDGSKWFYSTLVGPGYNRRIAVHDVAANTVTELHNFGPQTGNPGPIIITAISNTTLFGITSAAQPECYNIDIATGAVTDLGQASAAMVAAPDDIKFDPVSGLVMMLKISTLFSINPSTLELIRVRYLGGVGHQLAIDSRGVVTSFTWTGGAAGSPIVLLRRAWQFFTEFLAGSAVSTAYSLGTPGPNAGFVGYPFSPCGIAADGTGRIYFSQYGVTGIWAIENDGSISRVMNTAVAARLLAFDQANGRLALYASADLVIYS